MRLFIFLFGCTPMDEADTAIIVSEPGVLTVSASAGGTAIADCEVWEGADILGACGTAIPFEDAMHWLRVGQRDAGMSDDGYPLIVTARDGLWIIDDFKVVVPQNSDDHTTVAANQFARGTWECTGSDLTTPVRGTVQYREGNMLVLPSLNIGLTVKGRTLQGAFGGSTIDGTFTDHRTISLTITTDRVATRTCVAVEG